MKKNYRARLWGFLAVLIVAAPALQAADDLTVVTVERKPFVMTVDGQLSGFSIDLWDALAQQLGVNYGVTPESSFKEMLDRVEQGKADLAIGNISITADRERWFRRTRAAQCAGALSGDRAGHWQPVSGIGIRRTDCIDDDGQSATHRYRELRGSLRKEAGCHPRFDSVRVSAGEIHPASTVRRYRYAVQGAHRRQTAG